MIKSDMPPDLAILLVHGIGRQRQGQTVSEVGGALLRWLEARVGRGTVSVEQALLCCVRGFPTD